MVEYFKEGRGRMYTYEGQRGQVTKLISSCILVLRRPMADARQSCAQTRDLRGTTLKFAVRKSSSIIVAQVHNLPMPAISEGIPARPTE